MKCCICNKVFKEHPNNAQPVKKGWCCDQCNMEVVIPERVYRYIKYKYKL